MTVFRDFRFQAQIFFPHVYEPKPWQEGAPHYSVAVDWSDVPDDLKPFLREARMDEVPGPHSLLRSVSLRGSVTFIRSKQKPMVLPGSAQHFDRLTRLKAICDATNQSPDWLLDGVRATLHLGARSYRNLHKNEETEIAFRAVVVPIAELEDSLFALASFRTSGGW